MRRRVWIGGVLCVMGAVALGWDVWVKHEAFEAQTRARRTIESGPANPAAQTPALHRGDVVAELSIPRLHVSVMVLEGADAWILKVAAGHIPGTGLPDHAGNIGIAAHRDTFFRPLRNIRANDLITLRTRSGVSRFEVSDIHVVRPADVNVLAAAPNRDLTLVTCYPFYYVGSAPRRFVVHARELTRLALR